MSSPIFIFSASWRSGSTMLQRLITSSNQTLIWGESGGALDCFSDAHCRYEQMLADGNVRFEHGFGGNGMQALQEFKSAGLDKNHQWNACMNPPLADIEAGYRTFLNEFYGRPATELGYPNWGIKEVQCGIKTANFLRKIYPNAKFIFLVRNPFASILSIKRRAWMDYFDKPIPLIFYAKHWRKLAHEFRNAKFGFLVKYEDLINNPEIINNMSTYLNINNINYNFITESRVDWKPSNEARLTRTEASILNFILKDELIAYNYKK